MGFSFEELKDMTLASLLGVANEYSGDADGACQASQDEIDRLAR
jgi:hypothetical protein